MTDKTVSERIERIVNELAKPNDKELLAMELDALVAHAVLDFIQKQEQTSPLVHKQCTSGCRKNGCPNDK